MANDGFVEIDGGASPGAAVGERAGELLRCTRVASVPGLGQPEVLGELGDRSASRRAPVPGLGQHTDEVLRGAGRAGRPVPLVARRTNRWVRGFQGRGPGQQAAGDDQRWISLVPSPMTMSGASR
jgi:hypothetical protein